MDSSLFFLRRFSLSFFILILLFFFTFFCLFPFSSYFVSFSFFSHFFPLFFLFLFFSSFFCFTSFLNLFAAFLFFDYFCFSEGQREKKTPSEGKNKKKRWEVGKKKNMEKIEHLSPLFLSSGLHFNFHFSSRAWLGNIYPIPFRIEHTIVCIQNTRELPPW